jgi:phage baseplate assembly protein W
MNNSFYKLPLRLDQVIQKKKAPQCALEHSVAQNIHLIISTYRGESAYSEDFGCSLWDEEFNIQFNLRWKEDLAESLTKAVEQFEKRLQMKEVKVSLEDQNELLGRKNLRVRRCLHVEIKGIIKRTNEAFSFRDSIYISPLAQK